jgi:dynein heavy chain
LLERCVKIALQPPKTVKQKIETMLMVQEKDGWFRKSAKHQNQHKNMFVGLAYFHAIMGGRKRYGTLGWHVPYEFDFGDFSISNAQLRDLMKKQSVAAKPDIISGLEMLRYFYSHVNYAGKVSRTQDQITINTILEDLINDEMAFVSNQEGDPSCSHHGFPAGGDGVDYYGFFEKCLPERDSYELYGFNWTIESNLRTNEVLSILNQLHATQRRWPGDTDSDIRTSIEMSSVKASLQSNISFGDAFGLKTDGQNLLQIFSMLQKLLGASSLGSCDITGAKRYDHQISQDFLPERDRHD